MQRESKMSLSQIEAMRAGARTAVRTCMGVNLNDRVFVLTDRATNAIGRASTVLTLGNTIGTYTVTATSGSLEGSPVTFTADATAYTGNIFWDGGSADIPGNGNSASGGIGNMQGAD